MTILTNIVLTAFMLFESGGDNSAVGDRGRALGALQIQPVMVREYNRTTGARLVHRDALKPGVQWSILCWHIDRMDRAHKRRLTVAELYQTWNAGPDAVRRGQSVSRGRRVAKIYEDLKQEQLAGVSRRKGKKST